jgi:phenylalanyl-tRNA synthetase beta chain
VEVKNKKDCPRYAGKAIFGVKVCSSPKWLQESLKNCGLQPINNIVDIGNYVMLETGQPIHAFDLDKIKEKIIVRRAKDGEKIKTLDNKIYKLDKDILVIADKEKAIGIAGIKGGESTGIDNATKDILIEAANFDRKIIRKASQKLKLRTDASSRFENGVDPNLIDFAQKRMAFMLKEIAKGNALKGMVDLYPKKSLPKKIKLNLKYVDKLLGIKVSETKVKEILKKLNFKFSKVKDNKVTIEIPTQRIDICLEEDLIEEIGRIYGYHNIPYIFPETILGLPKKNNKVFWQKQCQDILKERGFSEVYNYSFISEEQKNIFSCEDNKLLELKNPVSALNKYLRPSLIPDLLKNAKDNLKIFNEVKIFELGNIFINQRKKENGNQKILEKKMLTGLLSKKDVKEEGFYELKGIVDSLLNKLGIVDIYYDNYEQTPEQSHLSIWHPKKCAEIKIDGQEVGFLGQIHPSIIEDMGIKQKVFVFDFDFDILVKLFSAEHGYKPISFHPAAIRDLSILTPQGTKVVDVLNVINRAGGILVKDVDLFDIYSGEGVIQGKENFAFHIIYQADDRTLSSEEIDTLQQKIIKALEKNIEWEVRK